MKWGAERVERGAKKPSKRWVWFALVPVVTLPALRSPLPAEDAPAPSVQAEVSPSTARLGDLITLNIRIRRPNGVIIEPPTFSKELGTFEVRASSQWPTEVQGEESIERFSAELQNFTTGVQPLPGIQFDYKNVLGKPYQLKTPELKVTIQELAAGPKDKGDIRGIKGVIGPVAWSPLWWGLLTVILLAAGIYVWKKRQKVLKGPPPPPPVPADETALKKLQSLKDSGWIESGKIKEFYSALSDILRGYLEEGFGIPALERTTTELMRDVQKHKAFLALRQVNLKDLLEECDLVKFAKFRPEVVEALRAHETALTIIQQTRVLLKKDEK